jgi:capsular polysaccharide biosynthesis protein
MADASPGGALTLAQTSRLAALVADVLADERPARRLRQEFERLDPEQAPALAAALFESLVYRVDVRDYWVHHYMARVYAALGPAREDAAYLAAARVAQMAPTSFGAGVAFRDMFRILHRRGRGAEAVAVFRHQMRRTPEYPSVDWFEIEPVLAELGEALPPRPGRPRSATDARRDHPVFAPEIRPPWFCTAVGGVVPPGLVSLATERWQRPGIDVAELSDAEVLISRDSVVVVDRNGELHGDLSICRYPDLVRGTFERDEQAGEPIRLHEADAAVVISDGYALPNLCHLLLDHLTRLAVYRRVGVDPARVLVVGAEARAPFQKLVLRRAGVTRLLGTTHRARLRARRLWVSSNCYDVRHFAHWGAGWAIEFVRETLGGRGGKGWRRLYVSRADATRRRVVNEAAVAALLEPHGFEVIVPGQMPYEQQVMAFRQASHVIAPHGAALAHMVLCPPGTKILEIFHPLFTDNAFAMQVQAAELDYVAMLARDAESDAPDWNDPRVAPKEMRWYADRDMRVDLAALSRYLATVV